MRALWGSISRRVPAGVMLLAFGLILDVLLLAVAARRPVTVRLVVSGLSPFVAGTIALVASGGAPGWRAAVVTPLGQLRRRHRASAHRLAFLEKLTEELEDDADRSAGAASRLFGELVRAEEAARATLAGELHDTVAQSLSAALSQLADPNGQYEGIEAVRDAEEQLRMVLSRLRPPELERGDLALAVSDLCLELEHRFGLEVEVSWPQEPVKLPIAVAVLVYRFLQEGLLNALEHADGEGVRLALSVQDVADGARWLQVDVSDEGPGFDPKAVVSSGGRHVGLRLAGERARLAGGALTVDSRVGEGTRLRLRLPLAGPRSQAGSRRDSAPDSALLPTG